MTIAVADPPHAADQDELRGGFPKSAKSCLFRYHAVILDDIEPGFSRTPLPAVAAVRQPPWGRFPLLASGLVLRREISADPVGEMLPVYSSGRRRRAAGKLLAISHPEGCLQPGCGSALLSPTSSALSAMPGFLAQSGRNGEAPSRRAGAVEVRPVAPHCRRCRASVRPRPYRGAPVGDLWRGTAPRRPHTERSRQVVRQIVSGGWFGCPARVEVETAARRRGARCTPTYWSRPRRAIRPATTPV